ncbi:hypothetical protein D3C87_1323700 [compost metagenome]
MAPSFVFAQKSKEEVRLDGFAQHQKNGKQFENARSQGEKAYLEEQEQWELSRQRTLEDYKKKKASQVMEDEGPEYQADQVTKQNWDKNREIERQKYAARRHEEILDRKAKGLPSEEVELDIAEERPRYDYRKRASFGASKGGKSSSASSPSSPSSGAPWTGGGGSNFPTPPPFDDFGGEGYVPAQNAPDDFGDIPPPPPPPPVFDEGFDGPNPIPPPTFDDGGDF